MVYFLDVFVDSDVIRGFGLLLFMEIFNNPQIRIILELLLAALLGALVGLEREYKKKEAGLRTHSLVALGAALFTIIGSESFSAFSDKAGISFDPSRVIAGIVIGVGFIGAGLIFRRQFRIEGLSTAAGLWMAAAIGGAIGFQLYFPAIFATFLVIGILAGLRRLEEVIFEKGVEKGVEKGAEKPQE